MCAKKRGYLAMEQPMEGTSFDNSNSFAYLKWDL